MELLFSIFAVFVSLSSVAVTLYVSKTERETALAQMVTASWDDILNTTHEHPRYFDINVTENYLSAMSQDERLQYDIFCQRLWGTIEQICIRDLDSGPRFQAIIHLAVSYHLPWLRNNPMFFSSEELWERVEEVENTPRVIMRYKPLPSNDGEIDWDQVAPRYFDFIISPFDPDMTSGRPPRNTLVHRLQQLQAQAEAPLRIADFGCGPGNLLPYLDPEKCEEVTGVDLSGGSLEIADRVAEELGIPFRSVHADMRDLRLDPEFDVVISSNSVLPSAREDVAPMLETLHAHLGPSGRLLAIMPSFDVCVYLAGLWEERYRELVGPEHAKRVREAFEQSKRMDFENLAYADDGQSPQCYHTPESITHDFRSVGIGIVRGPEKVYYPWEMTARFDYGFFPDADEEIWDWYVEVVTS